MSVKLRGGTYYLPVEVAEKLGISQQAVSKAIFANRLKAYRIGMGQNINLVHANDIEKFKQDRI